MRTTSLLVMLLGLLVVACSSGTAGRGRDSANDPAETEDSDDDDDASEDSGDGDGDGDGDSDDSPSDADDGTSPDDDSDEGTPPDDSSGDGDGDGDGDDDGNMSLDPYDVSRCDEPGLDWRSGHKTVYESYPDPGSPECEEFNGCKWAGQLAACEDKQTEEWVEMHNIVAVFPDFDSLERHDLCIRRGDEIIVATVFDTCGDSDCEDCCTNNLGDTDQLIDLEKYTEERWGLDDGPVEWADLGPSREDVCE